MSRPKTITQDVTIVVDSVEWCGDFIERAHADLLVRTKSGRVAELKWPIDIDSMREYEPGKRYRATLTMEVLP